MSRLRLFQPQQPPCAHDVRFDDGPTATLSFDAFVARLAGRRPTDLITRARLLHRNRRCPDCGYPVVKPIELQDAVLNRNNLPIPCTASLVGFHCDRCQCEWPAEPAA